MMNFQFGGNLADQNVAAKNAKAISDGKFFFFLLNCYVLEFTENVTSV